MAIAFSQFKWVSNGTSVSPTVTFDSAVSQDDIILAFVQGTVTNSPGTPAGWTNIGGANWAETGSGFHAAACMWHVVTAGEDGNTAFTITNFWPNTSQNSATLWVVYSGVDTTTPIDDWSSWFVASNQTTADIESLTPTADNGVVLGFVTNDALIAANTTPSGWTSRAVNSTGPEIQVFEWNTLTTNAVATSAQSVTGASDQKATISLILAAAGAAPSPSTFSGWGVQI